MFPPEPEEPYFPDYSPDPEQFEETGYFYDAPMEIFSEQLASSAGVEAKPVDLSAPEFRIGRNAFDASAPVDPRTAKYPFMNKFMRWQISSYSHMVGRAGKGRAKYLAGEWWPKVDEPRKGHPEDWYHGFNPSFQISRGTGVTAIDVFDQRGNTVSEQAFLDRIGLTIHKYDNMKTEKRLSRIFRPSYAFGMYEQGTGEGQIQITDFEADEKKWDGVAIMSRRALELLTEGLPAQQRDAYRKAGRFAATIMDERGQMKSDLIVRDDLEGTQILLPTGSWKKEVSLDTKMAGGTFIDIRPRHTHAGDLWLDSQTHTNLYSRILSNNFFFTQLEQKSQKFLQQLATGFGIKDAAKMFADAESGQQFDSQTGMVPFEYLARGGALNESPEMMGRYGDMYRQKIYKASGKYRLPFKEMFGMYLTSGVAAPDEIRNRLERGSVYIDPDHAAIYYHEDDYEWAASVHGGGDQDDLLKATWYKLKGQAYGLFHRSPNTQGEYTQMRIANPEVFRPKSEGGLGVKPINPALAGLARVTQLAQKNFMYPTDESLPSEEAPKFKSHREMAKYFAKKAQENITVVGQYINAMTAANHILGREPFDQATPSENVIDRAQKTGQDLTVVKSWFKNLASRLTMFPMPKDDWRRLHSMLDPEQREEGYIPSENHWVDEVETFYKSHIAQFQRSLSQLQAMSGPPAELIEGAPEDAKLKGSISSEHYYKYLPDKRVRRSTQADYLNAHEHLYSYLQQLPQEERDKYLTELLVNPLSSGKGKNETGEDLDAYHTDRLAWLSNTNPETGEKWGTAYMTMDMLTRKGLLNERPTFAGGPPPPPKRVTRAMTLITRPNWEAVSGMTEEELTNGQTVGFLEKQLLPSLVGTLAHIRGGRVETQNQSFLNVGKQHGALEFVNGLIMSAKKRYKDVVLTLADRSGSDIAFVPRVDVAPFTRPTDPMEPEGMSSYVMNNLSEAADKVVAGELGNLHSLSTTARYALNAEMRRRKIGDAGIEALGLGEPISNTDMPRTNFDPYAPEQFGSRTYEGRMRSEAPPRGYYKAPFVPKYLPQGMESYSEGGNTFYGPRTAGPVASTQELEAMGRFAGSIAQRMMSYQAGEANWKGQFLEEHFGAGADNEANFSQWVEGLSDVRPSQGVSDRQQFETMWFGLYGDYLYKKGIGQTDALDDTAWVSMWGAHRQRYGLNEWPDTVAAKRARGAGGMPPPPEEPPYDYAGEPPEEPEIPRGRPAFDPPPPLDPSHPFARIYAQQPANKAAVARTVAAGGNVGVFTPPGSGKTEYIKAMLAELGGVLPIVTPLNSLNEQLSEILNKKSASGEQPFEGFYLPGDPGYGVDRSEYVAQSRAIREALQSRLIRRPGKPPKWNEDMPPIGITMSPEKMMNLDKSELGRDILHLARGVALDEAQVPAAYSGREALTMLSRQFEAVRQEKGGRFPVLLTGGTVSKSEMAALGRAFNLNEVIREPVELSHMDLELSVVGGYKQYPEEAVKFAREVRRPALYYSDQTASVDSLWEALNQAGVPTGRYHRGQGKYGEFVPESELEAVMEQFREERLTTSVAGSPAIGLGLNTTNLTDIFMSGIWGIGDFVQALSRVRPTTVHNTGRQGRGRIVVSPDAYERRAAELAKDFDILGIEQTAQAFEFARGLQDQFDPNWKKASDQISKAMGWFLKDRFNINPNRGADVHSALRISGLIDMDMYPVIGGRIYRGPDRENIGGAEMALNWRFDPFNPRDVLERTRFTDPYLSEAENLPLGRYYSTIGHAKSQEYNALAEFFRTIRPGDDPVLAGQDFKKGLIAAYQGRLLASAPENKAGHENIGVTVQRPDGSEYVIGEKHLTGPESSEISITTYARAFMDSVRSGGRIVGSHHTQPEGRGDQPSQTDIEGLGRLGRIDISEGPPGRMRAAADVNSPEYQNMVGNAASPPGTAADAFRHAQDFSLPQGHVGQATRQIIDLIKEFQNLSEQIKSTSTTVEATNKIQEEYGKTLKKSVDVMRANKIDVGTEVEDIGTSLRVRSRAMMMAGDPNRDLAGSFDMFGQDIGFQGMSMKANRLTFSGMEQDEQRRQNGDWSDRPGMIRLSSIIQAMRSWRYIADPVVQSAYQGTNDYNPIAAASGQAYDYGANQSGYRTRMQLGAEYQGRGAYQAFAGMLDLPYAMSGYGGGYARATAAAQVGLGVMTSGTDIGYGMLSQAFYMRGGKFAGAAQGLESLGFGVSLASIVAGTALTAGSFAQEVGQSIGLQDTVMGKLTGGRYSGSAPDEGYPSSLIRGSVGVAPYAYAVSQKYEARHRADIESRFGANPATNYLVNLQSNLYGSLMGLGQFAASGLGFGPETRQYMNEQFGMTKADFANIPFIGSDQFADYMMYEGETPEMVKHREAAEKLATTYGGQSEQFVAPLSRVTATFGLSSARAGELLSYGASMGIGAPEYASQIESMMMQRGIIPGTPEAKAFATRYVRPNLPGVSGANVDWTAPTVESIAREQLDTQRIAGFAGQLAPYMGYQQASQFVQSNSLWQSGTASSQVQAAQMTLAQAGSWGIGGSASLANWGAGTQAMYGTQFTQSMLGMAQTLMNAGMDRSQYEPMLQAMSDYFGGYSQNQLDLTSKILGGDVGAASYAAWNAPNLLQNVGFNPQSWKLQDQYGRNIWETSGAEWLKTKFARNIDKFGIETPAGFQVPEQGLAEASAYLGTNNPALAQAFLDNGVQGMQWYMQDQQYTWNVAGLQLSQDQLAASQTYTRQMWGYQDQMRNLQNKSQMADFRYSRQRMDWSNQNAIAQENLSWTRMGMGQEFNLWQTQFGRGTELMQRRWTREDWDYQDTMRGMSREWNMEDLNEAIRFSTGRERRKLIRQRDRTAISQGMEDEQIDTQRERQQQLWGREDERYKKLIEYIKSTTELDKEQFELNKKQREESYQMERENLERKIKEYQQQFELEGKMQEAGRAYQETQWDFQQRSLDMQKEQLELQRDYELSMRGLEQDVQKTMGEIKQIAEYNPAKLMQPLVTMLSTMQGLDKGKIDALARMLNAIGYLDPTKMNAATNALTP